MEIKFKLKYDSHWGEELFLTGNMDALGSWNPEKALAMRYVDNGYWSAAAELDESETVEYKYIVKENGQIRWETRGNRCWKASKSVWDAFDAETMVRNDGIVRVVISILRILITKHPD